MRILLLLAAALPLVAQCTYQVTPLSATVSAEANQTGTVRVTAPNGCAWTAASDSSWLKVVLGQTGSGTGQVGWSVDRNPAGTPRSGRLTVAGQGVVITQAGQNCSYTPIGETSRTFDVSGGNGVFEINTTCQWQALSSASWIKTTSTGDARGVINYTVDRNPCTGVRSGTITVGSQQFSIVQDGSPSNLTISPTSGTVGSGGGTADLTVTTGSGCTWSAQSSADWLTVVPVGGSGPQRLEYRAAANTGTARTGIIRVGPQSFTLNQDGAPGPTMRITAIVNAASYATPPVAPGEIVTIYGTAIGPTTLVKPQLTSDGTALTKLLGATSVLFDGTQAAMIYTSEGQVSAVVPYGVAGKQTTSVVVEYNGTRSPAFPVTVAASSPAIFTLDQSGKNAGAILNQDFSINGTTNPAERGSVIQIFCTGAGVTLPASVDGQLTGVPLPELSLPVAVLIGGAESRILYKGGAPGSVAGLTQINAEVPLGILPGDVVPVRIRIGDRDTQDGVTVSVK